MIFDHFSLDLCLFDRKLEDLEANFSFALQISLRYIFDAPLRNPGVQVSVISDFNVFKRTQTISILTLSDFNFDFKQCHIFLTILNDFDLALKTKGFDFKFAILYFTINLLESRFNLLDGFVSCSLISLAVTHFSSICSEKCQIFLNFCLFWILFWRAKLGIESKNFGLKFFKISRQILISYISLPNNITYLNLIFSIFYEHLRFYEFWRVFEACFEIESKNQLIWRKISKSKQNTCVKSEIVLKSWLSCKSCILTAQVGWKSVEHRSRLNLWHWKSLKRLTRIFAKRIRIPECKSKSSV